MNGLEGLSSKEQERLTQYMQDQELRQTLSSFAEASAYCFDTCVSSFRSNSLDNSETRCITNCTTKFLATSQRAAQRFIEQNMMAAQGIQPGGN